jgi:hypothetical protein
MLFLAVMINVCKSNKKAVAITKSIFRLKRVYFNTENPLNIPLQANQQYIYPVFNVPLEAFVTPPKI